MSAPRTRKRVVDESLLAALLMDNRAVDLIPAFRQFQQGVRTARTCCDRAYAHRSADLRALKERVRGLGGEDLAALKRLTEADILVFYGQGPGGLTVTER